MNSKWVRWNEPLWVGKEGKIAGNSLVTATVEDIINYWKLTHPQYPYTDEEAIQDFMTVYWAWFIDDINNEF